MRVSAAKQHRQPGKRGLLDAWIGRALLFRGGFRHSCRYNLRQLGQRYRRKPGHGFFPFRRRGGLHENHAGLQRLVPGPIRAVLRVHGPGRSRAVRGLRREKSFHGHRRGLVPLPLRHVLRHHQLSAGRHPGRVPGDGRRLWFYNRRDARAGYLRIRRRHRANHNR